MCGSQYLFEIISIEIDRSAAHDRGYSKGGYEGTIGEGAFQNCSNLPRVTIPKSVTYLDLQAFSDCNSLKSLTWNAKECIIGTDWLHNVQLTELIIGDEVELIPAYWMEYQSSLTSLVIPASVTWIGEYAFEDCYGLTRIDAYPDPAKVTMGEDVFICVEKDGTLHVLPQYLSAYQTANQWRDFTNIKGDLSEFVKGDVNKDKEVSIADVTTLVNILMANESPIAATDFPTADVNEDGEVGIADVTSYYWQSDASRLTEFCGLGSVRVCACTPFLLAAFFYAR